MSRPRSAVRGPRSGVRGPGSAGLLAAMVLMVASAAAAADAPRGIAFVESLDEPAVVATAVPDGGLRENLPIVVHLTIDLAVFEGPNGAAALDRLGARLALYRARKIRVVVVLGALPVAEADVQAWHRRLRTVAERHRGAITAYEIGAVVRTPGCRAGGRPVWIRCQAGVHSDPSIDPDAAVALGPIWATDRRG